MMSFLSSQNNVFSGRGTLWDSIGLFSTKVKECIDKEADICDILCCDKKQRILVVIIDIIVLLYYCELNKLK